mmetsp:Transcript_115166/g.325422  ORF Transcript_115166/g.325422 Transcript_115166/m.325422 type:complete len:304 (+) Transcript_115166:184-1095(+)
MTVPFMLSKFCSMRTVSSKGPRTSGSRHRKRPPARSNRVSSSRLISTRRPGRATSSAAATRCGNISSAARCVQSRTRTPAGSVWTCGSSSSARARVIICRRPPSLPAAPIMSTRSLALRPLTLLPSRKPAAVAKRTCGSPSREACRTAAITSPRSNVSRREGSANRPPTERSIWPQAPPELRPSTAAVRPQRLSHPSQAASTRKSCPASSLLAAERRPTCSAKFGQKSTAARQSQGAKSASACAVSSSWLVVPRWDPPTSNCARASAKRTGRGPASSAEVALASSLAPASAAALSCSSGKSGG